MAVVESLRPDRSLLNAKFDSYKLSPDQLQVHSSSLPALVNTVTLKDDVFSPLHVKAFGWTNHLVIDQWNNYKPDLELLYFVDENNTVNQVTVKDGDVQKMSNVFHIPPVEEVTAHQLNGFVIFPSSTLAVASDGAGRVYILKTGDRSNGKEWEVLLVHKLNNPFCILHSVWDACSKVLSCLLLSVTNEGEAESIHVTHTVVLTLLTFYANTSDQGEIMQFVFDLQKEFHGRSVPSYAVLEPSNKAIILASEKPFTLLTDDKQVPLDEGFSDEPPVSEEAEKPKKPKKEYAWSQESEEITILFSLPEGTAKEDILFDVKTHKLAVSLKNGQKLLDGELFSAVESDACTWTLEKQRLEITLVKTVADHVWLDVVKGDERGQYKPNGENLELLEDTLNKKTNDATLFNQGDLEECDSLPEDVLYILRMDIKDGTVTHKTSLSTHQWLFTKLINPTEPPAFCVRHDVDALLWQPRINGEEAGKGNWQHIGTLNAFGYVHASKKEQKFTSCSSDFSYAVICDARNHLFTYYQPQVEDTTHAEQKLVQLDDVGSEGIIGIQACNKMIFVLCKDKLFLVSPF